MSGLEIYTKKQKFIWNIACMDIGVTIALLSAIFIALFSIFSMPYHISCVFFLQGIAIPLAIFAVWGRKYKIIRHIALLVVGVISYFLLKINAFHGVLPCVNSAIQLINKCYRINLSQIAVYGMEGKTSFWWVLCTLECLFAVLFLHILKREKGRFYGILVLLLPVILGIFCGKVPEILEGCLLVLAIFFFIIASYQREYVPIKAFVSVIVVLAGIWLIARPIESSIYRYKRTHLQEYREMQLKLIEARSLDIADWIPEEWKKINIDDMGADINLPINLGVAWNKHLQTLASTNQSGKVVDEVVVEDKPTSTVYWKMFEGHVYTGNGWEKEGTQGVYDELDAIKQYCVPMENYSNNEIAYELNHYFREDFKYTKNPGKMPKDKDFAEGFMFEKKKGFCVHFATAATIVYQMCDKEARYAEGYMILPSDFKEQEDGSYKAIVTDDMAHAWCETYEVSGKWTVREHTIPEGLRAESPTITPSPETEVTIAPTQIPSPEISQTPTQEIPSDGKPTIPAENNSPTDNPTVPLEGNGQSGASLKLQVIFGMIGDMTLRIISYLLGTVIVIVIISVIMLLQRKIRVQQKQRKFRSKYVKRGILSMYRAVQNMCIFEGLTDRELWRRESMSKIAAQFPQLSTQEWDWLYDCVERTIFSNDVIRIEEQKQMYGLYQKLRKGILKSLKGRKRLWFLYGRAL